MSFQYLKLAFLPVALVASQALAQNFNLNWDENISFKKYHSYIWAPRVTTIVAKSPDYAAAQASIDRYLASRGFKTSPNGEFAVGFTLAGAPRGDYEGSYEEAQESRVGYLSVDIYDTASKRPIWHAELSANLTGKASQAQLDHAVATLLNRFPPSHGCSHSARDTIIFPCPKEE